MKIRYVKYWYNRPHRWYFHFHPKSTSLRFIHLGPIEVVYHK